MKFGKQFEFHKIPEWYTDYVDYVRLKELICMFKKKVKSKIDQLIINNRGWCVKIEGSVLPDYQERGQAPRYNGQSQVKACIGSRWASRR